MSAASATTQQLLSSTNSFFNALSNNTSPITLLSYFSTTRLVSLQHAPATCPHPHTSRLTGLNAIRSYFDLLATHWTRTDMRIHSAQVDSSAKQVVVAASVTWMWKKSRKSFTEDFTCTLQFDDNQKIVDFLVCTNSGPGTCVMRAVDAEPQTSLTKTAVQVNM
ncbi:hypothetical protein BDN72DRAFT_469281 [Pluteus cervinus]|uniref:Uncharacterized protein n=1 Tax=Pluteus cervinus TaxID=181527 RepID=A0ACD3B212_9AGAR|nr:hypothetical protein BDN72DRAFT_469281 [Pluteus cervinus]